MFIAQHMNVECMLYSVHLIKFTQLECLLIVFFFSTQSTALYICLFTLFVYRTATNIAQWIF